MQLPDFLTADDGGFISATGHRIGLHHVIRLYNDAASPEMIAARFPSLPLALVHKIIAFYLENGVETDNYVAKQEQALATQSASARSAPTLVDLRSRLETRQRNEALASSLHTEP